MNGVKDFFIEESYKDFETRLNLLIENGSIGITNEGIIPVEGFLYFIWLRDENWLNAISYVINHEGCWEFYIYEMYKNFEDLKHLITRIHSYQYIDYISQLEIKYITYSAF